MKRYLLPALILVVGLAAPARTDDAEEAAVLVVRKLGGTLTRDDKAAGKPVVGVDLSSPFTNFKVSDAELKELAGLKQLQTLDLTSTKVTDAGLKELAAFKQLKTLNLRATKITDAGLKELASLKQLEKLYLREVAVTDAGLKHLAEMTQLKTVDLWKTNVTDAGMRELAALTQLEGLGLSNTQVGDAGLKELAGLKQLQKLILSTTQVTDEGLKHLLGMKQLVFLNLSYTGVSDAGLKDLAGLKQLQSLGLYNVRVTEAGLKELAVLPELQSLGLYNTRVGDAGMKELAALKKLQTLELAHTRAEDAALKELLGLKELRTLRVQVQTDAGLKELAALKQLVTLEVHGTRLSAAALEELRKALPACTITQTKGPPPKFGFTAPKVAYRTIDLEIANTRSSGDPIQTLCVPLSLSPADAAHREVLIEVEGAPKLSSGTLGHLAAPGLFTDNIPPAAADQVRRDLYFRLPPAKPGAVIRAKVVLKNPNFVGYGFGWTFKDKEYSELAQNYGKMPMLRYVHKPYDNSSKEARAKSYSVFHHLYASGPAKGFQGREYRFVTNGGDTNDPLPKDPKDNLYPHHRGLMFAYSKITFDGGKECNMWAATPGDTHQEHAGFLATETGRVLARQRVAVDWHGPKNEIFAKEEREITAFSVGPGKTLIEFTSRLKTTGGLVKLRGDPQHAGFHFRAHNDLHEQKNEKQTYFLRPDGKGDFGDTRNWDPKTKKGPINLPFDACSFVLDGKRYTLAYLNHPSNPGESRWSERDYGRFGCYFEYDLTEKNPLVLHYRIWLQPGEMTVEQVEALSKAFREPPKVTVKYARK